MSNMEDNEEKKKPDVAISMAAIGRYIEDNIVEPVEVKGNGRRFVSWGLNNGYPDYLLNLRHSVPTLGSVIAGCVDYAVGNGVTLDVRLSDDSSESVNRYGETAEDIVTKVADDLFMFGGFALQIIRNNAGEVAELYHLDLRHLRTNEDKSVFFYSEDFGQRYLRPSKMVIYPKFMRDGDAGASVLYFCRDFRQVYPSPCYRSAVKACEMERCTDDYHLNSVLNGFAGSIMVNFNNGVPEDEIKAEIEEMFTEKFSGPQNAGRIVFCWNNDKESATTIDSVDVPDFGDKYQALEKHSRQEIFTAFRANPNLFGIPTEGNGFSSEEYKSAFDLFNRTMIRPAQKDIVRAFACIFGRDSLRIEPFTLSEGHDTTVER